MTQSEVIAKVQEACQENDGQELSRSQIESVLKNYGAVVIDACKNKTDAPLPGVGKFKGSKKPARTARNPKTGENIEVGEKIVGKFSFGSSAKKMINIV